MSAGRSAADLLRAAARQLRVERALGVAGPAMLAAAAFAIAEAVAARFIEAPALRVLAAASLVAAPLLAIARASWPPDADVVRRRAGRLAGDESLFFALRAASGRFADQVRAEVEERAASAPRGRAAVPLLARAAPAALLLALLAYFAPGRLAGDGPGSRRGPARDAIAEGRLRRALDQHSPRRGSKVDEALRTLADPSTSAQDALAAAIELRAQSDAAVARGDRMLETLSSSEALRDIAAAIAAEDPEKLERALRDFERRLALAPLSQDEAAATQRALELSASQAPDAATRDLLERLARACAGSDGAGAAAAARELARELGGRRESARRVERIVVALESSATRLGSDRGAEVSARAGVDGSAQPTGTGDAGDPLSLGLRRGALDPYYESVLRRYFGASGGDPR